MAGLFLIPFAAMLAGGLRSQAAGAGDTIQSILVGAALLSGLAWLAALPYYLMIHTPACGSCGVRTKPHGKARHGDEEWRITICPRCRERFMHRTFGSGPD